MRVFLKVLIAATLSSAVDSNSTVRCTGSTTAVLFSNVFCLVFVRYVVVRRHLISTERKVSFLQSDESQRYVECLKISKLRRITSSVLSQNSQTSHK